MNEESTYLTISEVAKILEVSQWTLRRWDEKGILKSTQVVPGMHRRYIREDVENFLKTKK